MKDYFLNCVSEILGGDVWMRQNDTMNTPDVSICILDLISSLSTLLCTPYAYNSTYDNIVVI